MVNLHVVTCFSPMNESWYGLCAVCWLPVPTSLWVAQSPTVAHLIIQVPRQTGVLVSAVQNKGRHNYSLWGTFNPGLSHWHEKGLRAETLIVANVNESWYDDHLSVLLPHRRFLAQMWFFRTDTAHLTLPELHCLYQRWEKHLNQSNHGIKVNEKTNEFYTNIYTGTKHSEEKQRLVLKQNKWMTDRRWNINKQKEQKIKTKRK